MIPVLQKLIVYLRVKNGPVKELQNNYGQNGEILTDDGNSEDSATCVGCGEVGEGQSLVSAWKDGCAGWQGERVQVKETRGLLRGSKEDGAI